MTHEELVQAARAVVAKALSDESLDPAKEGAHMISAKVSVAMDVLRLPVYQPDNAA